MFNFLPPLSAGLPSKYPRNQLVETDRTHGVRATKKGDPNTRGALVDVPIFRLVLADRNLKYPRPHQGDREKSRRRNRNPELALQSDA